MIVCVLETQKPLYSYSNSLLMQGSPVSQHTANQGLMEAGSVMAGKGHREVVADGMTQKQYNGRQTVWPCHITQSTPQHLKSAKICSSDASLSFSPVEWNKHHALQSSLQVSWITVVTCLAYVICIQVKPKGHNWGGQPSQLTQDWRLSACPFFPYKKWALSLKPSAPLI